MWSVINAPTLALTTCFSLLALHVEKVEGHPLYHRFYEHPESFYSYIIEQDFPFKSANSISFKLFPFWFQDIIISLIAIRIRVLVVLIPEKNFAVQYLQMIEI